jgi:predicted AAA+ superfamily ATPase
MLPSCDSNNTLWLDGENADVHQLLKNANSERLKQLAGNHKIIVIDEAQKIENIGSILKLFADYTPHIQVIASGSSAFELRNSLNEPLTGRKFEYKLFPISFSEMSQNTSFLEEFRQFPQRLIYGYYPEIVTHSNDAERLLRFLSDSYLYKDILTWERIQKPDRLEKLVQALAFQVGQLVSYNELGQMAGLDNETVEHYIQLLEKAFIVFRLGSFNRNLRNELKKSRKIYFYDNGLRNALVNQFNPLNLREDKGALWENFLMSERLKINHYHQNYVNTYFWRNLAQQEIDYIEEHSGEIHAFEFKWSENKKITKFPNTFLETYQPKETSVINQGNYQSFILQNH